MKKKVAEFSQGAVYAYTIQNEAIHMTALNFGAVITELKTSDRSGNMENVVAAFSDIMDYERFCAIPYNQYAFHPLKKNTSTETRFFLTLGCLQTGRIQLLLINTIVLHSLCFTFTHRRERTPKQIRVLFV